MMSSFSSAPSGRRLKLAVIFLLTAAALLLAPFCFCRAETASTGTTATTGVAESTTQTLSVDEQYEQEMEYDREVIKKESESADRYMYAFGIVLLALLILYTVSRLKLEKKEKRDEAPYAFENELSPEQEKKFGIAKTVTYILFAICWGVYLFKNPSDHYQSYIEENNTKLIFLFATFVEGGLSCSAWKKKMERIKYIAVIIFNVCMNLYFIVKIIKL